MSLPAGAANGVEQAGNALVDPIEAPAVLVVTLPVRVGNEWIAGNGAKQQDGCRRVDTLARQPDELSGLHDEDDIDRLVAKREIVARAMGLEVDAALPGDAACDLWCRFAALRIDSGGEERPAGQSGRPEPGRFLSIGASADVPLAQEQDPAGSSWQPARRQDGHHAAHDTPSRHRGHESVREPASAVAAQEWTYKRQDHARERITPGREWSR